MGLTSFIMNFQLIILFFVGAYVSADFFVDLKSDSYNPLERAFCCLATNSQNSCATGCVNQDCSATCTVRCGVLSSVCGSHTCSSVTSSCTTTTTTTSSCLVGGAQCQDSSSTLGQCCSDFTCTPLPPTGGFCLTTPTA